MTKVTYEEAINSLNKFYEKTIQGKLIAKTTERKSKVEMFIEQYKPPTWDEVIKLWQDTIDDEIKIQRNDEGIRINYPNGIYYLINLEQVYSNRKVFSMNVNATLNAINLTIRYLESQQ